MVGVHGAFGTLDLRKRSGIWRQEQDKLWESEQVQSKDCNFEYINISTSFSARYAANAQASVTARQRACHVNTTAKTYGASSRLVIPGMPADLRKPEGRNSIQLLFHVT